MLLNACKKNNKGTVLEVLSKGCDINFADYDNRTALHVACSENHLDLVNLLIEKGINKVKDRWGNYPFDDLDEETRKKLVV